MDRPREAGAILDATGQPMRAKDDRCPRCRSGKDQRVASAGFGEPHPVCGKCGYEWIGVSCDPIAKGVM